MRSVSLPVVAAALFAFPSWAEDTAVARRYIVPYVGSFDVFDHDHHAQFGVELRWDDVYHGLRPTLGVNVDNDGDLYGYGGGNWDIPLGYHVFFTPNVMIGAYTSGGVAREGGDGKSLGGGIEFRSGLELSYAFDDASRMGVAFNHISNASLYRRNPGAETVLVNYQIPFSGL